MEPHPRHERYDTDERRYLGAARAELAGNEVIDLVTDAAAATFDAAAWRGVPDDAPANFAERRTAAAALAAIALRTTRAIAVLVRAGYGPETLPAIRKLGEAVGHAQQNAGDASGQFAVNWLRGLGRAAKPRSAYASAVGEDESWGFLSEAAHASFTSHAATAARLTSEREVLHRTGPERRSVDGALLWQASRMLISVLAAVYKVHPDVDDSSFLEVAERVIDREP